MIRTRRGQIIDGPEPGHVGLGSADAAAKGEVRIKPRVRDGDGGAETIPAEIMPLIVFNDCDSAAFQFLEIGEYGMPHHPAERTGQAGRHHAHTRRRMTWNNGFLHDAST